MAEEEINFRQMVGRLNAAQFKLYLVKRGWKEKPSRFEDHSYFQTTSSDGVDSYELYLPVAAKVPGYTSRLMRTIYKLCGIEDREPHQIAQDMLACVPAFESAAANGARAGIRVRNSGATELQVQIETPPREHVLLPGEAIELKCDVAASGLVEIDRNGSRLTIRTANRS